MNDSSPKSRRANVMLACLAFDHRPLIPFLLSGAIVGAVKWGWLNAVPW